jgi:hypothetical protein
MRSVKIIGALATAVCALCVAAVPALAHEFTANAYKKTISPATPVGIKGGSEEVQEFRLAQFTFTCEKTVVRGKVTSESSETLYNQVKFSQCVTYLVPEKAREKLPFKVKFKQSFDLEYHANGYVGSGGESESEVDLVNPGPVEAEVMGTKCILSWLPQVIPVKAEKKPLGEYSAAVFSTEEVAATNLKMFPSGFQKKLVITNEFTHLKTEVSEGKCEEFERTETKTGYYKGSFTEEIPRGNLSFN